MTDNSSNSKRSPQGTSVRRPQGTALHVRERVRKLLVEEFELDESDLLAEADLYTDLGLDSLDTVDLVVALKEEFGFEVDRRRDEERIRTVRTLEDLYGFVNEKMSGGIEQRTANGE